MTVGTCEGELGAGTNLQSVTENTHKLWNFSRFGRKRPKLALRANVAAESSSLFELRCPLVVPGRALVEKLRHVARMFPPLNQLDGKTRSLVSKLAGCPHFRP